MVGGWVFAHRLRRFCSGRAWSLDFGALLPWTRAGRPCRLPIVYLVPSAGHFSCAVFLLVFALAFLVPSLGYCGTFDVFYRTVESFFIQSTFGFGGATDPRDSSP